MNHQNALSELERFANQCIAADRYPNDYHIFTPFRCDACGIVPLVLNIEHHTGSEDGNFRGQISGRCTTCGRQDRLFSFTGAHRESLREEQPVCQCGHDGFLVGMCERYEGDEGLRGFFDEGVIAGQCAACGQHRAFVYTD